MLGIEGKEGRKEEDLGIMDDPFGLCCDSYTTSLGAVLTLAEPVNEVNCNSTDLNRAPQAPLKGPDSRQILSVWTPVGRQLYVELSEPGGWQPCPLGGQVSVHASHLSPQGTRAGSPRQLDGQSTCTHASMVSC